MRRLRTCSWFIQRYPYQALRTLLHAKKLPYVLSSDFRQTVHSTDPLADLATLVEPDLRHSLSSRKLTQLLSFRTQLPNYLLNYLGDRQEMAHSVEARLPLGVTSSLRLLWPLPKLPPPLDQYLQGDIVRQVGVFDPVKVGLIRRALPFIPKHSYQFTIAEALPIGAASLHIVNDLFCRKVDWRAADVIKASPWGRIAASPTVSECANPEDLRRILA